MDRAVRTKVVRRPRFRRAEPPAFRLTDDDIAMFDRWRVIASYDPRRSPPWLTARSIERMTACLDSSMPAMSIARARNSITIRHAAPLRWYMRSLIAGRDSW